MDFVKPLPTPPAPQPIPGAPAPPPATPRRRPGAKTSTALLLAASAVIEVIGGAAAADKIPVTKQDDLPRHTYPVSGTVSELLKSPTEVAALAKAMRSNIEDDLARYDIQDRTTQKGIEQTLLVLDMIEGRDADAQARIARIRELEEKPAKKLTAARMAEARIAAFEEVGKNADPAAYKAAFRRHYAAAIESLPWEVVGDELEETKGQLEISSENLIYGIVQEQLEPMVAKTKSLSREAADQVVGFYSFLNNALPLKEDMLAVLDATVAKHQKPKVDIWAARTADLTKTSGLQPVTVAIWDTGVDVQVFKDQVVTRKAEKEDGRDDDVNGYTDDVHGIAYDKDWRQTTGLLYPMDEAKRPVKELEGVLKGLFDLQAALDTKESRELKVKMAQLGRDDVKSFLEDLTRYNLHAHGTHVAGIAVAENPAARILVCRLSADPRMIPDPPTVDTTKRMADAFGDVVSYFRANQVRVVNMSWVINRSSFEHDLELNGIGKDAEERKAMAREMFDIAKASLETAFKSAPEILFVGGAGNSDNDTTFDEFVPPMFKLPNLLIAGAVDQAGEATSFTSFGPTVTIYASGFEVDSYVPGGTRMKLSGTSMASPNVANLAAKLIALDSRLTPPEVIELIQAGADERRDGDRVLKLVNPKRSVELLRERRGKAASGD
jgi:subtilisin family serine protease